MAARGGRDTATGNTRDPEAAEVAVLDWIDQALQAGYAAELATTCAGVSQRCCRGVRSSGCPPVGCGVGYPITYQSDITLIAGLSMAAVLTHSALGAQMAR